MAVKIPAYSLISIILVYLALSVANAAQAPLAKTVEGTAQPKVPLNVAVLYSTRGHRGFFKTIQAKFEREHPDISLTFNGLLDAEYKQAVLPWLMSGKMDVLYWQAGERLTTVAKNNLVLELDDVWRQGALDESFPNNIKEAVSYDNQIYALPYAYYTWGMFYNKALLSSLQLTVPTNWTELIAYCKSMRSENLVPIMIGSQDPWLPAAWFDYLNLRINGLAFHRQVLAGQIPYTDERIVKVFNHWKILIDNQCFNLTHEHLSWRALLPPLFRQMAGMTLLGNFLDNNTPPEFMDSIGYQPFPSINEKIKRYEDVPLDVFVISKRSRHIDAAKKFLQFMARVDVQSFVANTIGQSSPHIASIDKNHFSKQNKVILTGAQGLAQYFDRDIEQTIVIESLAVFKMFLSNPDVNAATQRLEQLRQRTL